MNLGFTVHIKSQRLEYTNYEVLLFMKIVYTLTNIDCDDPDKISQSVTFHNISSGFSLFFTKVVYSYGVFRGWEEMLARKNQNDFLTSQPVN